MSKFKYTPDREQKVHSQGAISLICKPFQSHESGIPEWAKNAADAYGRENAPPDRRVIVLFFSDRPSLGAPTIGCLDFVGTTSDKIENYFRHWADPEAAAQGTDFRGQGGHGNGGKCYMTQMFEEHALFHTVCERTGCRYGVEGGSLNFGWVPDVAKGREFEVPDHVKELETALKALGCRYSALPPAIKTACEGSEGFTLVTGVGPKHHAKKIRVKDLMSQVRDHPQMLTTLEYCKVFVVYNGKAAKEPLQPETVEPILGAEEPRVVDIPSDLVDPVDGATVSTTQEGRFDEGKLTFRTSNTSMRWKKKARHTINYRTGNGFIGYKSMLEFPVNSGYRDKIYGECELEALERFKQNDRAQLADSPLTRTIDNYIAEQVEAYAREFEAKDRQKYSKKERHALSQMNEALDRWKNRFMKNFMAGAFGSGGGPDGREKLPTGKPARIEVRVTHPKMGLGVAIRPIIRFFDARNRQIRSVPYRWVSEDPNVAMVEEDLMIINSFAPGETVIYAELIDGKLESNRVPIQVLRIRTIRIEPKEVELEEGSRLHLIAVCTMSSGEEADDVALVWTESNSSVARVSATGMVYGAAEGSTDVIAGDDRVSATDPVTVRVVEADRSGDGKGKGKGKGGKGSGKHSGGGYPLILVSGEVDPDPETEKYVNFSPDDPPVTQRPQDADRNIWWINSAAPLAKLYLDKESGYGYQSREWRMYHLERYVDIVTQIAVSADPQITGPLTVGEYFLYSADKIADIHAAIAEELGGFIQDGEMPH